MAHKMRVSRLFHLSVSLKSYISLGLCIIFGTHKIRVYSEWCEKRYRANKILLPSCSIKYIFASYNRPLPSNEHYLSCDACLKVKREDNQNCSVLCCVRQLCTMIHIQMWAVLTVLWIGFCHTELISLCVDLFVFYLWVFCAFLFHTAYAF